MTLFEYDQAVTDEGYAFFCGVDEAGRGSLAGPVYAAAVILPPGAELPGLADSKKLTEKQRGILFDQIRQQATSWCIADACVAEIEEHNILGATMLAMRRAVQGLDIRPALALVDGNRLPRTGVTERCVIKGDDTSACIAAASILAKVARDTHMLELAKRYPSYRFEQHKGYGTKLHYAMLDQYGPCEAHRESFLKKWRAAKDE